MLAFLFGYTNGMAKAPRSNGHKSTGTQEYARFMSRLMRSYGKKARASLHDPEVEFDVTALEQLNEIQAELDATFDEVVAVMRQHQYSWAQIGRELGITRAAAFKRYGHLDVQGSVRVAGGQPGHLR